MTDTPHLDAALLRVHALEALESDAADSGKDFGLCPACDAPLWDQYDRAGHVDDCAPLIAMVAAGDV